MRIGGRCARPSSCRWVPGRASSGCSATCDRATWARWRTWVDPINISATLIDLAVHGHLRITELPRDSEFAATDWTLARTDSSADDLRPFEAVLLDGVVGRDEVKVSELPIQLYETVRDVQDKLYDEVVANGWFDRRPDAIRNRWTQTSIGALIGAVVITVPAGCLHHLRAGRSRA